MTTITPEHFARICYLTLMESGNGLYDKSPDYTLEKAWMLNDGYDAFAYLDFNNMKAVINWCVTWNLEIPKIIQEEFDRQNEAREELIKKGFDI